MSQSCDHDWAELRCVRCGGWRSVEEYVREIIEHDMKQALWETETKYWEDPPSKPEKA